MRVLSRLSLSLLAFGALAGPMACAAEAAFGLQAEVVGPLGDLKTFTSSTTGFGAGLHALLDFGNGQTLRPRMDYASFPGKSGFYRLEQVCVGADYVYFTESRTTQGVYLVAGAGVVSNGYITNFQPTYTRSYTGPYGALGIGYQFNQALGLEVRYLSSRFTDDAGVTSSVNSIAAGATFRF